MRRIAVAVIMAVLGAVVVAQPAAAAPTGSAYTALPSPVRIMDTRTPTGGHQAPLGANEVATLPVRGAGGGTGGRDGVVVNVTAVEPSTGTYLALTPDGQAGTSTVNVERGAIRATTFTDSAASAYVGSVSDDGTMIGYLAPPTTAGRETNPPEAWSTTTRPERQSHSRSRKKNEPCPGRN